MDISVLPEYPVIHPTNSSEVYFLIKLEISASQADHKRIPIHLSLVLDRSGSMAGTKLQLTQQAACYFMNWLTRHDSLAVVIFDHKVEVLVPHQLLTDKRWVSEQIQRISDGGSTNLSGGWLRGISELKRNYVQGHIHRVLLLTDGEANVGITDNQQLWNMAAKTFAQGVSTSTLGFGADFNENLLKGLAEYGGGHFYFVAESERLAEAFRQEFGQLVKLVGQNLEIRLQLAPGVKLAQVLSEFPGEYTRQNLSARLGDVHSDELKQFIFAVQLPSNLTEGKHRIGDLHITYDRVVGDMECVTYQEPLMIEMATAQHAWAPDPYVRGEVWMARSAQIKLKALQLYDQGKLEELTHLLLEHASNAPGQVGMSEQIEEEKSRLQELAVLLSKGSCGSLTRKAITAQAYSHREQRGIYQQLVGVHTWNIKIHPGEQSKILDITTALEKIMHQKKFPDEKINNVNLVIHELVHNALEHGCPNNKGTVQVQCYIADKYVRIIVQDEGPGFDYQATLQRIQQQKKERRYRGRGLLVAQHYSDSMRFSDQGRRVEVLFLKEQAVLETALVKSSNLSYKDDIVIFKIPNAIASSMIARIKEVVSNLTASGWVRIILDLAAVNYVSSSGLGMLIYCSDHIEDNNGEMVLANVHPRLQDLLDCVGLTGVLKIFDTLQDAVDYLR